MLSDGEVPQLVLSTSSIKVCHLVQEAFLVVLKPHSGEEAGGKRCLAGVQRKID